MPRAIYSSYGLALRALVQCAKERSPCTHRQQRTELLWNNYKTDTSSHHGKIQVEGSEESLFPSREWVPETAHGRDGSLRTDNLGRRGAQRKKDIFGRWYSEGGGLMGRWALRREQRGTTVWAADLRVLSLFEGSCRNFPRGT